MSLMMSALLRMVLEAVQICRKEEGLGAEDWEKVRKEEFGEVA
jgi:hypothetical protein